MHAKKNSQNNFKMHTQKRTNIWKIVRKNMKQQETKPTHTLYIYNTKKQNQYTPKYNHI